MGGVFQVSNFQVREGGWNTSGWDTGISVNQGNAGAVLLCLHCRNWNNANSTASGMYLVRLGYDGNQSVHCLLYTSPSPRDATLSRMPAAA